MKIIRLLIIFYLLGILHPNQLIGQATSSIGPFNFKEAKTLDSALYQISYKMDFIRDTTKRNVVLTNKLVLHVGKNYNRFFNAYYLPETIKQKPPKGVGFNIDGKGLAATEFIKNKKDNKITTYVKIFGNKPYKYTEKVPILKWQLLNQKQEILGYTCQAAKVRFLGRDYTAWFTQEIPIKEGPWKFSGLPGLILKVYDTKKDYIFECTEIRKLKNKRPILECKDKYIFTTRKKLNLINKQLHKYPGATQKSWGLTIIRADGSSSVSNKTYPYNPIDLE